MPTGFSGIREEALSHGRQRQINFATHSRQLDSQLFLSTMSRRFERIKFFNEFDASAGMPVMAPFVNLDIATQLILWQTG